MERGVYSAATAMATAQQWLDVVTNNLANASTTGYKKDGLSFDDGLIREMSANGGRGAKLGTLGSGSVIQGQYTDFSPGSLTATGNMLDLAVQSPNSAFAVQTDAGIRYTRDGAFGVNSERTLVDKSGHPVLNVQNQPITVPKGKIAIAENGAVSVNEKPVDQIGVFSGTLRKQGGNLFSSNNARAVDNPRVVAGSLESSNVNAVEEMIAMIRLNRVFELAQRSVQSQDESTQRLVSSLQGR